MNKYSKMKILFVVLSVLAVTQADNVNLDFLENFKINFTGDTRIVGGEVAKLNQFPYQALVVSYKISTSGITSATLCSGSLISKTSVLTAAQCLKKGEMVGIALGANKIYPLDSSQIFENITNFIIHPSWDSKTLIGDVAIVKLPTAATLNERVGLVNLPSDSKKSYEKENATVSGWGQTSDGSSQIASILRFTSNPVITNEKCFVKFSNTTIKNSHICVSGEKGKSPCNGDAGGPLTVTNNNVTTQIGIMSLRHIIGCQKGYPAVYTRITTYLDWIKENSSGTIEISKYLFIVQLVLYLYSKMF